MANRAQVVEALIDHGVEAEYAPTIAQHMAADLNTRKRIVFDPMGDPLVLIPRNRLRKNGK